MPSIEHVDNVTPTPAQVPASERKIETLIRARLAATGQAEIAAALEMNASGVSRWMSGHDPVPLARIGPFLEALGLVVMSRAEHDALRLFAARSLLDGLDPSKGL